MKKYEELLNDELQNWDFSSLEDRYDSYKMSGGDDEDEADDDDDEKEDLSDNDWGDVDPLDNPLRAPGPMDPSGPGSAV